MDNKERWFHCILYGEEPYACFGIASKNGKVTQAAPVAAWMIGKDLNDLRDFFKRKKALVTEIK